MAIEDIRDYDFRKKLSSKQVFENLRDCLVEQISEKYEQVVGPEYLRFWRQEDDVLIYEMNEKMYPGIVLTVRNDSGCGCRDYSIAITPFNVFLRQWGLRSVEYDENTKNVPLTKIHRKVMKGLFGENYEEAKKEFIEEVKEVQLRFAKIEYDNAVKTINEKYKNDSNC